MSIVRRKVEYTSLAAICRPAMWYVLTVGAACPVNEDNKTVKKGDCEHCPRFATHPNRGVGVKLFNRACVSKCLPTCWRLPSQPQRLVPFHFMSSIELWRTDSTFKTMNCRLGLFLIIPMYCWTYCTLVGNRNSGFQLLLWCRNVFLWGLAFCNLI